MLWTSRIAEGVRTDGGRVMRRIIDATHTACRLSCLALICCAQSAVAQSSPSLAHRNPPLIPSGASRPAEPRTPELTTGEALAWLDPRELQELFDSTEHDVSTEQGIVYRNAAIVGLELGPDLQRGLAIELAHRHAATLRAILADGDILCSPEWVESLRSAVHQPIVVHTSLDVLACTRNYGTAIQLHIYSRHPPSPQQWQDLQELTIPLSLTLSHTRLGTSDYVWLSKVHALRGLALEGTSLSDADLVHLLGIKSLEELNLAHTNISDVGLQGIDNLHSLRVLDLRGTGITDASLTHVARLSQLTELRLAEVRHASLSEPARRQAMARSSITDAGLQQIARLSGLRVLDLRNTSIRGVGGGTLRPFRNLRELYLSETPLDVLALLPELAQLRVLELYDAGISDFDLAQLATLTHLRRLVLEGNEQIRGPGLRELGRLKELRELNLGVTGITELSGLEGLSELRELRLAGAPISNKSLKALQPLKRLTHLDLEATGVTDAGLNRLGTLSALRTLNLNFTAVGDRGVWALVRLARLKDVMLGGTQCTCAGLAAIRKVRRTLAFGGGVPCEL